MLHLILAGLISVSAPELEVRPLDGPTLKGTLVSLDGEQLKITTADGEKSVAVKELATATVTPAPAAINEKPQVWVHLTGGSVIHGTSYVLKEKKILLTLLSGETLQLAPHAVHHVRFQPLDENSQADFDRVIKAEISADVIIIRRAGKALDELDGIVRDINADTVLFEFDGEKIPVDREKIFGIRYY